MLYARRLRRRGGESSGGLLLRGCRGSLLAFGLYRDFGALAVAAGFTGDADFFVALFQVVQLFVGKFLDIDEIVTRRVVGADKFVQLQVERLGVSILRVLDEKDHKESNDGGAGVNDELPGVRKMEERAACSPDHQNNHG